MKNLLPLLIFLWPVITQAGAISCIDAISMEGDAKLALHEAARNRAIIEAEDFTGKKIEKPIVGLWEMAVIASEKPVKSSPMDMATLIETSWCETHKTPLNAAYYRFYTSVKYVYGE